MAQSSLYAFIDENNQCINSWWNSFLEKKEFGHVYTRKYANFLIYLYKIILVNNTAFSITRMATWKSPTCGRVKIPHPRQQNECNLILFLS